MNICIHAVSGEVVVVMEGERVDVVANDRGPGIADVSLALTPGYSTASEKARAMGFGAGLGFTNMQRCADRFRVETKESVHLLCLFDRVEQALDMQALVYAHLPSLPPAVHSSSFGQQFVVDCEGRFLGYEQRPLFMATDLSVSEVVRAARERGGLVLGAHADRRAHGLLAVLGFVPPDLALDALECGPGGLTAGRVASSDAHRLEEIGSRYAVFDSHSAAVEDLRASLSAGGFRTGLAV